MLTAALLLAQARPEPDWLPVLDAPGQVGSRLTLPHPQHAGEPLELSGRVTKNGRPVSGIVLYVHHTDAQGHYPRPARAKPGDWSYWHGSLRGWLKTGADGRYWIKTTRPAPYPGGTEPAHVHVYGLMPGSRTGFMFSDFVFQGDPLLTERYWARDRRMGHAPYGGVRLTRGADGCWRGTRDLVVPDGA